MSVHAAVSSNGSHPGLAAVPEPPPQSSLNPDAIYVDGVDLVFGSGESAVVALQDTSLRVKRGEKAALLGPSGCGKSTLLRILADLLPPAAGNVSVCGTNAAQARKERLFMLVAQSSTLLPWRTLRANVELAAEIAGHRKAKRRAKADEVIELVGLKGFEDKYPHQLSGGMRQRGCIARALSMSPELLLMDEPFGALDEITRERLNFELLDTLAETNATMLLVTHSIGEAVILAERVHVMSGRPGRIVETIEVPFEFPRTPEVRDDPRFAECERKLRHALERAMAETHAPD